MLTMFGLLFLLASLLKTLLALCALWVCIQHRRLSPWMWCVLLGLVGVLSQAGSSVLMLIQQLGPLSGDQSGWPTIEESSFWWLGLVGGIGEIVGDLGVMALLLGLPFLVRDLVLQFELWKDLQSGQADPEMAKNPFRSINH